MPPRNDFSEVLRGLQGMPLMQAIAQSAPDALQNRVSEITCRAGEILFHQGDPCDYLYVIVSGCVEVLREIGEEVVSLGFIEVGHVVGEMGFMEQRPRNATIKAVEHTELLALSYEDFQRLLREEPKLVDQLLRDMSARLRATNQERVQAFTTERGLSRRLNELKDENERLAEIMRLREETTHLIVHDLRNPLSGVINALYMLPMLEPNLNDNKKAHRAIELASYNTKKLLNLVNSLLEVARMQAGEFELHCEMIDISSIGQQVVDQARLINEDIYIAAEINNDLPNIYADSVTIERTITNLIDNAIKYSPINSTITLKIWREADDVVVSVSDQGPGIPPSQRRRIFDRFTQVGGEGQKPGFGLGLTFCRGAVEAHGGQIWIEDGPDDQGTTFVFNIPIKSRRKNA
jgi:signal transduction histidine kinase